MVAHKENFLGRLPFKHTPPPEQETNLIVIVVVVVVVVIVVVDVVHDVRGHG